jgi:hypothetical protein
LTDKRRNKGIREELRTLCLKINILIISNEFAAALKQDGRWSNSFQEENFQAVQRKDGVTSSTHSGLKLVQANRPRK